MTFLRTHGPGSLRGAIISGPPLKASVEVPAWKEAAAKMLGNILPKLRLETGIPSTGLSHDPKVAVDYEADPRNFSKVSASLYLSFVASVENALNNPDSISIPSLWPLGMADPICHAPTTRDWVAELDGDHEVLCYEDWFHEVHNEIGWERVVDDIDGWMKERS